jgi:hypothetical protein
LVQAGRKPEQFARINHGLDLHQANERFRRSMEVGTAIFCAVDKIEIRRMIWDAVKDQASFFTDGRMSAEVLRVLTACDRMLEDPAFKEQFFRKLKDTVASPARL